MNAEAFAHWLGTGLGSALLNQEQACVATAMTRVFGTRHLEVGLDSALAVTPRLPEGQQPQVLPKVNSDTDRGPVIARPEELPFHDDWMDSVVLHHTLDLAEDPRQALREAVRVVRSGGQVIVIGFNPVGLWGLRRLFGLRREAPWNSRFLLARRVQDWAQVLGCCVAPARYGFFRPPVGGRRLQTRLAFLEPFYERGIQVPFGGFYCVVAEKRDAAGIPLRPVMPEPGVASMPVANRNVSPGMGRARLRVVRTRPGDSGELS
ncbi:MULTISPECIES: class I SAM-dependent methyltransferase [Halomonadaceae]|jgi:SAM-dependent methyltransferase|uniref:Methyltransferase domain-containing protein n=2 Tax=Halomonadaceae TaxID=28256 RepID=A0A9X5B6J3_9GAMM|nr:MULTISPECIES: methyltransferase domain-containing protein [Halomonas]MYL27538.1 methyltransferase domain-containing protein [Halomonas utahensis]MYL74664.1 methyltransferase domain-containing protein [Halomonas sp. 22501_18_FS]